MLQKAPKRVQEKVQEDAVDCREGQNQTGVGSEPRCGEI